MEECKVENKVAFEFKTKPFAHQLKAFEISRDLPEFALLMGMGTGKSKVIIDTIQHLYLKGEIDTVIIFGNKGSYKNWINNEIPAHLPETIPKIDTYWEANPSAILQVTYEMMQLKITSLKIMVMNIEALAYEEPVELITKIVEVNNTLLVIDESTTIKNEGAKRTKNAIKLGKLAKYRRILTGEPIANSPLDIWAQAKFLNPELLGFPSYYAFQAYYARSIRMQGNGRNFRKVTGYQRLKELEENIARWSFRVKKEECLDLPPKVYQQYTVELTSDQERLYNQLKHDSLAFLSLQTTVSVQLAITKLLRLHQLVCGHLTDDNGVVHSISNNRISALMNVLNETDGKVIIWATYRKDIEAIERAISKDYGPETLVTYYGDTRQGEREDAIDSFQDKESEVRFFIGNPKSGGYGLTLTEATTVVYYSNNYELEVRLQSEDRAHRIGQTKSVNYVDLITPGTVDEKIIKALRSKKQIAAACLGDEFSEWI